METSDANPPGLWGSLRRVLDTLLGTLQTRMELFATELQEQQDRWINVLILALAGAFLGTMGLLLTTVALVLAAPPRWRLPVTAALGLVYLASATVVFFRLCQQIRRAPPAFAESVAQIGKDRAWLKTLD